MYRNLYVYAVKPGTIDEAEDAFRSWIQSVEDAPHFKGGSIWRENNGEWAPIREALIVTWDLEARSSWPEFRDATLDLRFPGEPDQGEADVDQIDVLRDVVSSHNHDGDGEAHDHFHGKEPSYDSCGGRVARLLHGHFEVRL